MRFLPNRRPAGIALAAILAVFGPVAPHAAARQAKDTAPAARADAQPEALVLVVPTGDRATGNLLIEAVGPAQVPVGASYEYRVKVTNISRSLVLEDVTIRQTKAKGFSI